MMRISWKKWLCSSKNRKIRLGLFLPNIPENNCAPMWLCLDKTSKNNKSYHQKRFFFAKRLRGLFALIWSTNSIVFRLIFLKVKPVLAFVHPPAEPIKCTFLVHCLLTSTKTCFVHNIIVQQGKIVKQFHSSRCPKGWWRAFSHSFASHKRQYRSHSLAPEF